MLRPAENNEIYRILSWRNHPRVRSASLTRHEIGEAEHEAWFAARRADPTSEVLLFEYLGTPSGVVTFTDMDHRSRTASWGFYLDLDGLDERGETLSAWLHVQRDAIAYAFDTLGLDELIGEVLEHNAVVRQMNRRLGFTEGDPIVRVVDDVEVRSFPIRLRRRDRAPVATSGRGG